MVTVFLCCGAFLDAASAADYVSIDIPGAQAVYPMIVNNSGVVAGEFDQGTIRLGFVRQSDGTIDTFQAPGANHIAVNGMNGKGQIVGTYTMGYRRKHSSEAGQSKDSEDGYHAFLRSPTGVLTTIDPPDATSATATGINAGGAVIGISSVGSYIRANDGSYVLMPDFPYPWGINDSGMST